MLTDAQIQRALKLGRNTQLKDGSGRGTGRLVLIIRNGRAEWYVQQWLNQRKRLSKLGNYPLLPLAEARRMVAEDFSEAINLKRDIRVSRSVKPGTIQELFSAYTAHLKNNGKPSFDNAEYCLGRVLKNVDETKLCRDATVDDFTPYLAEIYHSGSKRMADQLRAYIRAAFQWGIAHETDYRYRNNKRFFIQHNPMLSVPTEPRNPGNRYLSVDELRVFWRWLHQTEPYNKRGGHSIEETNLKALRVIVLTGQRVEMICRINQSMIKGDCVDWEKTKNGLPHLLPLPEQALRIIESTPPNERGWLFPQVHKPENRVSPSLMKLIVHRFCERSGVAHFSPRDLRRTWKTLAGHAGVSKEYRDLIQHHVKQDVSSVHYDRYEYLPEKTAGMKIWSEWFRDKIESPS